MKNMACSAYQNSNIYSVVNVPGTAVNILCKKNVTFYYVKFQA
jgi:hypothetical protein